MANQDDVLSQLGKRLGLYLSFDKNKQCCLMLDESLMVSIKQEPSGWIFYGMLQDYADEQEKTFWQHLLIFNLSLAKQLAGTITYEPESGALLYIDSLPLTKLDVDTSYAFLEGFVTHLERVREHLLSISKVTSTLSEIVKVKLA